MPQLSRRESLSLGTAALSASMLSAPVAGQSDTRLYEHTFLKAKAGLRAELGRFIVANWFAMDQRGVEQGIFTSYWLLEETGENAAWDYVMVVGYPQDQGFGDARTAELFQTIRKAHNEIKIDGKGLRDLGDIVGNHRLKIAHGA